MTRTAQSLANALTADQARLVVADFLSAVERCDEFPDIGTLITDLQKAVRMAEQLAGITDQWRLQTERIWWCARCREVRVGRCGRLCSGCRGSG